MAAHSASIKLRICPGTAAIRGVTRANLTRQAAIAAVQQLSTDVGIPTKLSELGVKEKDIDFLADSAMADACTPGNPRDVVKADIIGIYESIL